MSTKKAEEFTRRVVSAIPELKPILQEHLEDNFGELLPHVLFGDITRWAEAEIVANPKSPSAKRLLALLDSGYENEGSAVQQLIVVSFLDNLGRGSPLIEMLGPQLRLLATGHDGL